MPDLEQLARLAESEFSAIVSATVIFRNKLRVVLLDDSYIDFWWSRRFPRRFAYHWERTLIDGTVYRHDNIPHLHWRTVVSFPKHFHAGAQQTVIDSDISENPEQGLRQFLQFAAGMIG
jgi:hypothetical protein